MRKLTMTFTAAVLVLGSVAMTASAQTQSVGAAGFHAQLKNATPIITHAACNGTTGSAGCGPGFVRACGPNGGNCRCVRC